ncbi:type-F conjugative transfer system mating-pair stabilization protein TraN [Acerihabitans sp. TG2]|uniref:type-F conjugative transfer system mating-pair stabilization protein TraN n=1 Tax=Acerihabitans sp. TG2 TaxID=3096008 RepID=UPI002B22A219|nr:type-F conjugative transfer system mating-pair stabilization protein TraN [Acerihabitans sp. TG2]MEA9392701.1 type-F conjugative transfer system mating-pair stabilization protein TraN [Acerihabitans sp. TG2]
MNRFFLSLLLLCAHGAQADAVSDAYNAGSSYGKSNSGQGTSGMSNTSPSSVIPGYTASPSQSGYYGGVQGGDGGIADKGQTELSNNDAAKAINDSSTKNPATTIDPNAIFITTGKAAEANADSITSGTNSQCTDTTVSKSTFQNYTCDKDVAVTQSCNRLVSIGGKYVNTKTNQSAVINTTDFTYSLVGHEVHATFMAPFTGDLQWGNIVWSGFVVWKSKVNVLGNVVSVPARDSGTTSQNISVSGYHINQGDIITLTITISATGHESIFLNAIINQFRKNAESLILSITAMTTVQTWQPQTNVQQSCDDLSVGGKLIGTQCTVSGGNRTTVVNGKTYTVYSNCWQYTDTYLVTPASNGNCGSLMSDPNCTAAGSSCTEHTAGQCSHQKITYQCQKIYSSTGLLCGSDYFCQTGDCSDTSGAGDSGFDTAVAKLAGLASAGDDVKNDQINVKAFTGQSMSCRKAMAGFSNCCVDSGWGNSAGLANCNSEEMAIGKAKAKKVVVSVGEACAHAVLGICIQKKQVYCVFGGKLARIIQEQGRRDQLGVSFGSGDSPNCRGITIPELQSINFDLINFSDFYTDLMTNQKIPDAATMGQQVKVRIAAQVNAQTGGK